MEQNNNIDYKQYFAGKRITKQGFGVLGRGYGVVKFLIDNGADLLITDMKSEDVFIEQMSELNNYIKDNNLKNKIEYYFGGHRDEDFINCDYVIQASGVPKDNKYLQLSRDNKIPVYQESSLFLQIINDWNNTLEEKDKLRVIGITGTRGKTTTTMLLYKIISEWYGDDNVHLGGNIRNVATLSLLEKVKKSDIIIMEMDSWICQGLEYIKYSPNIAIWTTFMEDHNNYYKGDMRDYFYDKARIFLYQKERDIFITTTNIYSEFAKYINIPDLNIINSRHNIKYINELDIINYNTNINSHLLGNHNKLNISLAVAVAEYLRIDKEEYIKSISEFQPVEGRLSMIRNINNIEYYNDSTSTTPDALMAAVSAMNKNIVLICGGRDKDINLDKLSNFIIENKSSNKIKEIIILKDESTTGTDKLLELFTKNNISIDYNTASNLLEAMTIANNKIKNGEVVLFSPGFASFGMFHNEYDRSDQFTKLVNDIK